MLKFAVKSFKYLDLAVKKIKTLGVYKAIIALNGHIKLILKNIPGQIWKYMLNFHLFYKSYSGISSIRNFCSFTGRTRSYFRVGHTSRMKTRELLGAAAFFGFGKASW